MDNSILKIFGSVDVKITPDDICSYVVSSLGIQNSKDLHLIEAFPRINCYLLKGNVGGPTKCEHIFPMNKHFQTWSKLKVPIMKTVLLMKNSAHNL